MTQLQLDCSTEDAKELVKEAFRRTQGISSIEQEGYQVVGKTGVSFPRVLWSYGENIYVDFSDPTEDETVPIEVWAEKSIWTNITADPQKFKRRFLGELEDIRGRPIEELQQEPIEIDTPQPPSSSIVAAIGYPVSVVIGALIGLFTIGLLGGVLLGMFIGGILGPVFWYKRENPRFRAASMYIGLVLVGIILAGIIQTGLNLGEQSGTALVVVLAGGMPVVAYLKRNPSALPR